jgi:hypothetical protein
MGIVISNARCCGVLPWQQGGHVVHKVRKNNTGGMTYAVMPNAHTSVAKVMYRCLNSSGAHHRTGRGQTLFETSHWGQHGVEVEAGDGCGGVCHEKEAKGSKP